MALAPPRRTRVLARREPPPPSTPAATPARPLFLKALQRLTWRQRFEVARAIACDRRVPRLARWLPLALAAYLAFPIDVIPDSIALLGQLDDVLTVALVLRLLIRLVPHEVLEEHLATAEASG